MNLKLTPTVYVPIGITGSGKSYWWENSISNIKNYQDFYRRIDLSRIRYDLLGDFHNFSNEDLVKKVALSNLKIFLNINIPIIYIDYTNIHKNFRKLIINESKNYNYRVISIVFYKDPELCFKNSHKNNKKIDLQFLKSEYAIFKDNLPEFDEGWDEIFIIK